MARVSGKNASLYGVLARTTVSVAAVMTDGGVHTIYTLVVVTPQKYWNPNKPPVITKQTGGSGPFNPVSAALYTVDYILGTVTFLTPNGASDVIKINGIEYITLQQIGDMFNWSIDLKIGIVDATAFMDEFATKLSGIRSWTATAMGYHVSSFWWDAFISTPNAEFYVAFYIDGASPTSERFVGAGTIDVSVNVVKDAAVDDKMTINGTGAIARLTS